MKAAVIVRSIVSKGTFHTPPEGLTVIPAGCELVRSWFGGIGPGSSICMSFHSSGCADVSVNVTSTEGGVMVLIVKLRAGNEVTIVGLVKSVISGGSGGAG